MIHINPVFFENYNCVQSIIANILHYRNQPWSPMFMGELGFTYEKTANNGFTLDTGSKDMQVLDHLYGITEIPLKIKSLDELKSALSCERWICLYVDGYICPWHTAYHKQHIDHYLLIIGIDKSEQSIICADPFFTSEIQRLPYRDIEWTNKSIELKVMNKPFSYENIFPFFRSIIQELISSTVPYWIIIKEFSDYLSLEGMERELFSYQDCAFINWLISVNFLSKARKNFVESLIYISKKNKFCPAHIADAFSQLSEEWMKLKICLLKYYYKKNATYQSLQAVKSHLTVLADMEEHCVDILYKQLQNVVK